MSLFETNQSVSTPMVPMSDLQTLSAIGTRENAAANLVDAQPPLGTRLLSEAAANEFTGAGKAGAAAYRSCHFDAPLLKCALLERSLRCCVPTSLSNAVIACCSALTTVQSRFNSLTLNGYKWTFDCRVVLRGYGAALRTGGVRVTSIQLRAPCSVFGSCCARSDACAQPGASASAVT